MINRNWLVSYPRSGSTWVRLLFANLLHPEEPRGYHDTDYMVPDFHALLRWNLVKVEQYTKKLFLLKSHHPILDEYSEEKTIYLYRDPRDVVISEYYFDQWEYDTYYPFDTFFQRFIRGETKFESWKLHVTCWGRNEENADLVHLVKYESLYENPNLELRNMCDFLQYPATDEEISTAVRKCTFEKCVRMSPKENVDPKKRGLYGKPGRWRGVLTKEQQDELWLWVGDLMEKLGYEYKG
jgi:hypothetical protein